MKGGQWQREKSNLPDPRACNKVMRKRKREGGEERKGELRAERESQRQLECMDVE